MQVDVVVVGAGPAGAAAAYWAIRHGLSTIVVERARFPRDKTCGDGLTAAAMRELSAMGIDVRPVAQPIRRCELVGPYGTRVDLPMEAGLRPGAQLCAVLRRIDLDTMVLDAAASAGAKIWEGAVATNLTFDRGGVAAQLTHDGTQSTIQARWVIGADGANSLTRRSAFGEKRGRIPGIHALRQYVKAPPSDMLSVYFAAELLPGYGWIFPLPQGGANVGIGVPRDPSACGTLTRAALTNERGRFALGGLGRLYRRFLQRPDVTQRIGAHDPLGGAGDEHIRAWPIPTDPDLTCLAAGNVLLVGDAARLADPMTGEGIGQALLSGRLAAEAVASGRSVEGVNAQYRRSIETELGRDLRFARFLLHAMAHRQGIEWGLKIAGATRWTRRNVARWMYEDYPRAYVLTPDRWGQHSMRGQGAYV